MTAPNILTEICAVKREHVAARRRALPLAEIEARAREAPTVRPFRAALDSTIATTGYGLIAEIKKASPSGGLIREDFDVPALARAYDRAGAACLSVLTDAPYFQGSDAFLGEARAAVPLPVLRKDFMIDPYQVPEARAIGADCILIILAAVEDGLARELLTAAEAWGMDALVEVHDRAELDRALALNSGLVGINNRDLRTLGVDLATSESLAREVPGGRRLVAESGIKTRRDIERLGRAGVRAFLVGEALMRAADVEQATRALLTASAETEHAAKVSP